MLKRKLIRSGLFGNLLLLMIAVAHSAGISSATGSQPLTSDTTIHWLRFDPVLLQLSSNSEMEGLNAPTIPLNRNAAKFIDTYVARNCSLLQSIKEKHPRYFKIMDEVFTKYKLPVELKYLAIVESELNHKAVSRVGAAGPWQFMPETARLLSLKVTKKHDERTHFYKSTVAAAKYMRDLYMLFDDWTLVIAAYNCGPAPVYKAIKRSGSRNFWKLQYLLPAETRGHVKKFIATHYFFEGSGSIATLTKDERISYTKTMMAFVEKQNAFMKDEQDNKEPIEKTGTEVAADKVVATAGRVGEISIQE